MIERTVIRARTAQDLPACVRLLAEVHEHSGYPARWPPNPSGWLTPQGLSGAWVAERDGEIVGHGALCGRAVNRVFVSPAARGQGLGTRLFRRVETAAAGLGRRPVVEVRSSDTLAIALYERLGWQRRPAGGPEAPQGSAGQPVTVWQYEGPAAPARFKDVALDAADHQALADWWCAALGYVRRQPADGSVPPPDRPVPIVDPAGDGPLILFNPVPEAGAGNNRMQLDVYGDRDRLLRSGARLVRERDEEIEWDVLADPEGNEFCVFRPAG